MRVAVSSDGQALTRTKVITTPRLFLEGVAALLETAHELLAGAAAERVVGGIAGVLQPERGGILFAPNLADWQHKPLAAELTAQFKASVYLQNDAALGALGEAVFGAGKGKKIVAYIAVGTGVGGARVVNGKIDEATFGFEPGHHVVDNGKTLEQLATGSPEREQWLAQGLVNTALFWSPDVIVVGGGVMHRGDIEWNQVEKHFVARWRMPFAPPLLKAAALGDESGLYGALAYGRSVR